MESSSRTIVVAGGSGQVGEGVVHAFLGIGDRVIVPTRSDPEQVRVLFDGHPNLEAVHADVGTPEGVAHFAVELAARELTPDHVVASLGGWWSGPDLVNMEISDWRRILASGLDAHFVLARRFSRDVVERGGTYTLINGGAAFEPVDGSAAVSVSAAGQLMLARALAHEAGDLSGRVLTIVASTPVKTRNRPDGPDSWLTAADLGRLCEAIASGADLDTVTVLERRSDIDMLLG